MTVDWCETHNNPHGSGRLSKEPCEVVPSYVIGQELLDGLVDNLRYDGTKETLHAADCLAGLIGGDDGE